MAAKIGGLGRGLDALFLDNTLEGSGSSSPVQLKLTEIEPNRNQPRKVFDDDNLAELAESIARHGVLQPLLVRPRAEGGYLLVAGERRWRAARLAGLSEVPVVIRELSDEDAAVFALIENLQREDLNPVEEAFGFQQLIETYSLSQEEAAKRVGKSRPAVANAVRLLKLPEKILAWVAGGSISAGHGRALLAFEDEEKMLETAERIIKKGLSVRETERLANAANRDKAQTAKVKPRREAYYDEVELALTEALGRRVKVQCSAGKSGGHMEIDFFDRQDLEKLVKALSVWED